MEIKEINAEIEKINSQLKAGAMSKSDYKTVITKKDELVKARLMHYISLCPSIEAADRETFYGMLHRKYYKKKEFLTEEDVWNKSIDFYTGDFA